MYLQTNIPAVNSSDDSVILIALMSGTSVDSIDGVLVEICGNLPDVAVKVLYIAERQWPRELRARLLGAMAPAVVPTAEICDLNILVAREFAALANNIANSGPLRRDQITAIASHGQTLCHLPPNSNRPVGSTLQIGDIATIAQLTGLATVGNFRTADMAVGGQGAPLVPFADRILLSDAARFRCIQNIGGIANVTFLPPRNAPDSPVMAFDTGPGNMLLDALASILSEETRTFDDQGQWAASGNVDAALLVKLQAHRFFSMSPPKSTGREDFGRQLALQLTAEYPAVPPENLLATAAELTAWSIADAYRRFLPRFPDEVILCGGGMYNDDLVGRLNRHLFPARNAALQFIDSFGIPNKAREAVCFAILGWAWLRNCPGNLPEVTGAVRPVLCGQYARP